MDINYDPRKAASNKRKHGIGFDEAQTALLDERALVREDIDHEEQRFILLGMSSQLRLLVVIYTVQNEIIRLISARPATQSEERYYG
ncbi:MAG TPA: BrnT family toxin [Aquirhabdus sp.]